MPSLAAQSNEGDAASSPFVPAPKSPYDVTSPEVTAADASAPAPAPVPAPAPMPAAPAPARNALKTKPLPDRYRNEQNDASDYRPDFQTLTEMLGKPGVNVSGIKTRYYGDEEQAARTLQVQDGRLVKNGRKLDTMENSGNGTARGEGAGRDIFVMTPDGDIRSSAAWENHEEQDDPAHPSPQPKKSRFPNPFRKKEPAPPQNKVLSMINHSSLAAVEDEETGGRKGGSVAAAGELKVEDGKLLEISDSSGHYKPDNEMMHQAIGNLAGRGVDMHDVAMKLTSKNRGKEDNLYASVRELESYGGSMSAERAMRDRRADMKLDLRREVMKREKAKAGGGALPSWLADEPELDRKIEEEKEGYGTRMIPRRESGAPASESPYMPTDARLDARDEHDGPGAPFGGMFD